jgi:hypothetical protein
MSGQTIPDVVQDGDMADATRTRYCGNCGKEVGATDDVCPHCDALLAAYEAPSGASDGSAAAVMPVDTSTPTAPPPGSPAVVGPAPIEVPTPASPIATAIEETKAAAEAGTSPGTTGEPDDDAWPISSQPRADTLTEIAAAPAPEPSPGPVSQTLADTRKKVDTPSALSVAESVTPAPRPKPEPKPTPPVMTSSPPAAHPAPERLDQDAGASRDAGRQALPLQKTPARGSSSVGQTIVFIVIAVFIFSRLSGGTAFFGSIVTFVAIGVVIWFIVRITNATGRKTTSMPWDNQRRKRRR